MKRGAPTAAGVVPLSHNEPPPLERITGRVNDLVGEARLWCDGAKVENQAQADGLAQLKADLLAAHKAADEARAAEKAPHIAAGKAVDEAWRPVLADAERAKAAVITALTGWLVKCEQDKRAKEAAAAAEAARLADEARAAHKAAAPDDLASVERADAALDDAAAAGKAAKVAATDKAIARPAYGRATGLVARRTAQLTNLPLALLHFSARPDAAEALGEAVTKLANAAVRAGAPDVPGFTIVTEQVAR